MPVSHDLGFLSWISSYLELSRLMLGNIHIRVTSQLEPDIEGHLMPLLTGRLISLNVLRSPRLFSHKSRKFLQPILKQRDGQMVSGRNWGHTVNMCKRNLSHWPPSDSYNRYFLKFRWLVCKLNALKHTWKEYWFEKLSRNSPNPGLQS